MSAGHPSVLLIDFCGPEPLLALLRAGTLAGVERLPERGAAAGWLAAVKRLLSASAVTLHDLDAVGVVAGPGSFTGVRTGVAAAKGLCEAAHLPLAVISRLAVLSAAAASPDVLAVLYAGRGEFFVRLPAKEEEPAREMLLSHADLAGAAQGWPVVVAEAGLLDALAALAPALIEPSWTTMLQLVHAALEAGGSDIANADAHYVRSEQDIYAKPGAGSAAPATVS